MMTIDGVAPYMVKGSSPYRNTTLLVCRHCVFVCDTMLRGGLGPYTYERFASWCQVKSRFGEVVAEPDSDVEAQMFARAPDMANEILLLRARCRTADDIIASAQTPEGYHNVVAHAFIAELERVKGENIALKQKIADLKKILDGQDASS